RSWAPTVAETIKKIPGVVDELDGIEKPISGTAMNFQVDAVVRAAPGFTPEEVEQDTAAILQGEPATTPVVVNDRSYTIRIRFPPERPPDLEVILNTLLVSSTGKTATVGTLANMVEIPGQTEIRRENLQRNV